MQLGTFSNIIYQFCNWFYRLAVLNILWIFFTLAGLILFGFFPATTALLATLRQFLRQNNPSLVKTFWHYYKKDFLASNKLGLVIGVFGILIYINITFLHSTNHSLADLLYYPMIVLSCLYFLTICYLLSSLVEFDNSVKDHVKNSILIMIYNPLPSLFIIFGFGAVYFANVFISGLSFFFSASLLALVILSSTHIAYRKIEKANNNNLESEQPSES